MYVIIVAMSQQDLPCTPPPPPQKNRSRVGSFFSHRCLVPPKCFLEEKVDFVGGICLGTHKNVVLRHNHLNPISTKLISFDNNE